MERGADIKEHGHTRREKVTMASSPDVDDAVEEEWEWVQTPLISNEDDSGFSREENEDAEASASTLMAGLHIWEATRSESLSSTGSSPVHKHGLLSTVMASERFLAAGALDCSVSEWIEPQLVFLEPHSFRFRGFEIYNLVTFLRNTPKAKEAFLSLLSDKTVWDAVMNNKAMQELTNGCTEIEQGLEEGMDSSFIADACFLYVHGKQACMRVREKLSRAVDILSALLGVHSLEERVIDELDATVKSCILLVAILVFLVIDKRSNMGAHLGHARS